MISFYRRGILMRKQLCRLPLTKIRTKAEIPQVSDFQIPAGFFALSSGAARPASAGTGVLSGSFRLTLKPAPERKSLTLLHRLHTELLLQRIDLALICLLRRIPSFCGHFIVNRILHAERFVQRAAECLVYVICEMLRLCRAYTDRIRPFPAGECSPSDFYHPFHLPPQHYSSP